MYIHEAISLAMARRKHKREYIRRSTSEDWKSQKVELRYGSRKCILRVKDRRSHKGIFDRQWTPTADDLMADDWELVD